MLLEVITVTSEGIHFHSRKELESSAIEGDSPVNEMKLEPLGRKPKYYGAREIPWETGRTIFQG